jgi:hypothetical protein
MRKSFFAIAFLVFCSVGLAQQAMNNDAIIKMVKAGLSDDVILATINSSPGSYDTTANGLISLKQGGASDRVIAAIVTKSAAMPSTPPSASASALPPAPTDASSAPTAPADAKGADEQEPGAAAGTGTIPRGARIVIAPMGGFETYFAAAVREKKVPVTLTLDKSSAQYFVVSTNTEWRGFVYGSGASWNSAGGAAASAASSTRGLEASIMVIDARSKDVVWAYEVHKSSHGSLLFGTLGARGQQSIAEACAKHLKEYIETGK